MPSKNRVKQWAPEQVYHIYNRGNNKQPIFLDDEDYRVFLHLLKRHLQDKSDVDKFGRLYKSWHGDIELLAFCLMPNHFHLLAYQTTELALSGMMRSVTTSYAGYFNHKYKRTGHVFQDVFKASLIDEDGYWQHISRYIHLNPSTWRTWRWSSLPYYLGEKCADWVRPDRLLAMFEGDDYLTFVENYKEHRDMLEELKHLTAN